MYEIGIGVMSSAEETIRIWERAGIVVEAIFRARYTPDEKALKRPEALWLQVSHITRQANRLVELRGEFESLGYAFLGKILANQLGLETRKAIVGTRPMVLVWDKRKLQELAHEYDLVGLVNELSASSGLENIFSLALSEPVVNGKYSKEVMIGMDASEYQQLAARTLIDAPDWKIPDEELMLVWNAIGLAGEAGEVAELVKKGVFHRHGVEREKLAKELGDVLWYVAALATKAGLDLGEIMTANIEKLRVRYPNGFSSGDSVARVDVEVDDEN